MLNRTIRAAAILGAVFSGAMVLFAGDKSSLSLFSLTLVFGAWSMAPFLLVYFRVSAFEAFPVLGILILLATISAVALSAYVYWTTFVNNPNPDAQDGLVFLILPLYQLFGLWVLLAAARFLAKHLN